MDTIDSKAGIYVGLLLRLELTMLNPDLEISDDTINRIKKILDEEPRFVANIEDTIVEPVEIPELIDCSSIEKFKDGMEAVLYLIGVPGGRLFRLSGKLEDCGSIKGN